MRRAVRALIVAVVAGGILFLFVLPGRTWLQQGRAMSQAERRIAVLSRENQELTTRAAQLQSTAYVEQIARQQFGLVKPGEQSYGILLPPATTTTTTVPTRHPRHG
jgi:cell division protein FtsB